MTMRFKVFIFVLLAGVGAWLVFRQSKLERQTTELLAVNSQLNGEHASQSQQLESLKSELENLKAQTPEVIFSGGATSVSPVLSNRVAELEKQIQTLQRTASSAGGPRPFSEYDPTLPPPFETPVTNDSPKRSWGTEQLVGAPDTSSSGDHPTAWASLEQNAGPEWLSLGYEKPVNIAEVRIRETFNPGAISKVTAVSGGQEIVLWEGTAAGGAAPRDFVVRANQNVWAQSVIVYLDTSRVAGWNEIDAVELVGRAGSRQWAKAANASSTYAEPKVATSNNFGIRLQ